MRCHNQPEPTHSLTLPCKQDYPACCRAPNRSAPVSCVQVISAPTTGSSDCLMVERAGTTTTTPSSGLLLLGWRGGSLIPSTAASGFSRLLAWPGACRFPPSSRGQPSASSTLLLRDRGWQYCVAEMTGCRVVVGLVSAGWVCGTRSACLCCKPVLSAYRAKVSVFMLLARHCHMLLKQLG